jgi:tetratricopeptide (TPR) repeat protein
MDNLKVHGFRQKGLLQEYLKNDRPISPEIFWRYSYNHGSYDKYIGYSRVTSDLVITYSFCMMLQANDLLSAKDTYGALRLYKKAMLFPFKDEMKGNEPVLYYKLSFIYRDLNDEDSQIKYLRKAIELKEDYWQAYQALGEIYQKDGNLSMAGEMLQKANKYGSTDKKELEQFNAGSSEVRDYLQSGDEKFGQGDNKGAIEDYTKAIESDPKYAEAYCNRGAAKYKLGDYKGAVEDCNKAIEFNQKFAIAYYNRGSAEDGLGDYKGSIKDYNKAIELNPKYTEAYSNRGFAKLGSGDNAGAIEDYNKVLELDPKYEKAYYNRGIARIKSGDYKGAIEDYNKAIELNPRYAEAYSNRGNARTKSGDYKGAIEDYNKALEINPKQANAYYNRGAVKYFTGDKQGALDDLNNAGKLGVKQAYDMIEKIQGR